MELKTLCNVAKVKVFMKEVFSEDVDFVTVDLSAPKFSSVISKIVAFPSEHVLETYMWMQVAKDRGEVKIAADVITDVFTLGCIFSLWGLLRRFCEVPTDDGNVEALATYVNGTSALINNFDSTLQRAPKLFHPTALPRLIDIKNQLVTRIDTFKRNVIASRAEPFDKKVRLAESLLKSDDMRDYLERITADTVTRESVFLAEALYAPSGTGHKIAVLYMDATQQLKILTDMSFPSYPLHVAMHHSPNPPPWGHKP